MNDGNIPSAREHPQLDALPAWPTQTIAVLATVGSGPHAIPVSAPLRAEDRRVLISVHRDRASLAVLRRAPAGSTHILAHGNIAFTARGRARVIQEPMTHAPDYAAIAIDVEHIDDHRQAQFLIESGIDRRWTDADERRALRERVDTLTKLATSAT
jgi:hypothetical protein